MFFDQATPDTSVYMIAGYSIFFVISIIYLASLFFRTRNLHRDLDTLESLQHEKQAPAPAASAAREKAAAPKTVKQGPSRKKPARKTAKNR